MESSHVFQAGRTSLAIQEMTRYKISKVGDYSGRQRGNHVSVAQIHRPDGLRTVILADTE